MEVMYRNRLIHVKCRVTPLLLSTVEPKELKNTESIEWVKINEKCAAKGFIQIKGKKHQTPKLLTCGLYLFKPHACMGQLQVIF